MKKKTIKTILFPLLFFFLLLLVGYAFGHGLENVYPEAGNFKPETVNIPLPQFAKYIFFLSFALAGAIAFGSLIAAGFRYAFSAGKPEAKKELKKHFLSIFGGIIILLLSYLILTTINPQLKVFYLPELEKIIPPPVTEVKIPEALEADPLERIKNVAKAASTLSQQIKQTGQDLKNALSQCDCSSGQSMCLCQGGGGAEQEQQEPQELQQIAQSQKANVHPFDFHLSHNVDPDLLNKADLRLSPESQAYLESTAFAPDFPLDLNREIDIAKESFGSAYQDSLNQSRIFVLGDEHYKDAVNSTIDTVADKYALTTEEKQSLKEHIGQTDAFATPNGEIIMNGNRIATAETSHAEAMVHEYAHVVDSVTEEGQRVFSFSPEYLKIYNDASQYYRAQQLMGRETSNEPLKETYGFVSNYGRLNPAEDFSEAVRAYYRYGGNASNIPVDPTTQKLIQERFVYLKNHGIVK